MKKIMLLVLLLGLNLNAKPFLAAGVESTKDSSAVSASIGYNLGLDNGFDAEGIASVNSKGNGLVEANYLFSLPSNFKLITGLNINLKGIGAEVGFYYKDFIFMKAQRITNGFEQDSHKIDKIQVGLKFDY